ncbi:MAG: aminotransferase class V-fold PLP-dependent enzyme [Pirellulales bacterium]|nr:aminotransferase class V-fold PLP-dependent enzyme [Pirellulales bacterium]
MLDPYDDAGWETLRTEWQFPPEVTYLNHGAFGPSPRRVRQERVTWIDRIESQPADFFERHLEHELHRVAARLGLLVGTAAESLVLLDNATAAMNVVAQSVQLAAGDEVLLTDHEYGAVARLWQQRCDLGGASLRTVALPTPLTSSDEVVERVIGAITPRTRLLVVSHVTSKTAVVLPVEAICQRARELGVLVCVDGPHALAMRPLDLATLDADFYAVSCHKWLAGPFGTGFLYAAPRVQAQVRPMLISWGTPPAGARGDWRDEFVWLGTRDPSAFMALPAAIDILEDIGIESFRQRTHDLARYARQQIAELAGLPPLVPDDRAWYGSMIAVPLPSGDPVALHQTLWQRYGIEVPVSLWQDRPLIRVSCHVYTRRADIDRLCEALRRELRSA